MSTRNHQARGEPRPATLMRFALWFYSFRLNPPTADDVRRRFEVSRATAFRWIAYARAAQESPTP